MSLLNRATESVTVFAEEVVIDSDGNKLSRPSSAGLVVRAVVQPLTSSERADGGFDTTSRYRLRLVNYPNVLGAQSKIEWRGRRYSVEGDAMIYNGSARTRHVSYTITRR